MSKRGKDLDALIRVVEARPDITLNNDSTNASEEAKPSIHACRGDELWAEFARAVGIPSYGAASGYVELPYKELLEESRLEESE